MHTNYTLNTKIQLNLEQLQTYKVFCCGTRGSQWPSENIRTGQLTPGLLSNLYVFLLLTNILLGQCKAGKDQHYIIYRWKFDFWLRLFKKSRPCKLWVTFSVPLLARTSHVANSLRTKRAEIPYTTASQSHSGV
jgi:hypothetical protein